LMALEADVDEPDKSPIFSKNPAFLKNHHVRDFVRLQAYGDHGIRRLRIGSDA
jgi:hypothetical protein